MKAILTSIGMYLIKQEWFQFAIVKMVTKAIEMTAAGSAVTATTIDDKLINFIRRNKPHLIAIIKREAAIADTPIDFLLSKTLDEFQ